SVMTSRPPQSHPPAPLNTVTGQIGSSKYAPLAASVAFGKVLRQAVAAICVGNGFDSADPDVLELLTHTASAYMKEISEGARVITENSGRTKMIPADIWLSLVNMGHNVSQLPDFLAQQEGRSIHIAPPKPANAPVNPTPLRVGSSRNHHPHIHDYFPPFPDPHTYVRSEISLEPDQSYERARELLAQKKREAETSLSDFFLRTHQSTCVFQEAERKIRNDARVMMEDRMEREAARKSQRRALKRKRGGETIEGQLMDDLPESLLEDEERGIGLSITLPSSLVEDCSFVCDLSLSDDMDSAMGEEDDDELLLEIFDTESSIVRRKIPAHCFVLDPTHEHRPYLSALMGDMQEEEMEIAEARAKAAPAIAVTGRHSDAINGRMEDGRERNGEDRATDNPYLRPPRVLHL
ncbi:hypothetical protein PMAYCL1PPCAC_18012, partial [Pristionchus mayeri]